LLFLPAVGYRNNNNGTLNNAGSNGNSTSKGECPIVKEETRTFGIETRLRNFDLLNATPMMCMNFVAELKHDFIIN